MPAVLGHPYRHEQFDRFIPLQVSKKLKLKTISSSNKESSLENKLYQERLGLALDINPLQNAFTFQQSKSNNTKSSFSTTLQEIDPFYRIKTSGEYEPKREHKVELLTLSHYIEAPELRNDYYSNLLCWSPLTNMLAIALQNEVYLWSSMRQEILPDLPYEDSKITALAYNNVNGVLAITRKDGSMSLVHDTTLDILGTFIHHENSICHVAWIPNSVKDIFAGDEMGRILHLYVSEIPETELSSQYPLKIEWRKTIHYHTQQICGICFSPDLRQMAIGGNDNLVTVWDITNLDDPVMLFKMDHKAAIRALQFCPWSPALLATGGGSMDRRIRFWHTHSGTLLESIDVKEQITSLNWSLHYCQIAATFGFGSSESMLLAAVYTFPNCTLIKQFPGHPDLRALSAVLSPDATTIAVAANDETVKFYHIWETVGRPKRQILPILGSKLLEQEEGNDVCFDTVMR